MSGAPRQVGRTVKTAKRGGRKDAEKALRALNAEVHSEGRLGADATLRSLCEEWLELARQRLRPSTADCYEAYLKSRILPALGHVPLSDLKAHHLDRFYRALLDEVRSGDGEALSLDNLRGPYSS
jgi:hypothetical protein